ncbi:MAG: HlyD family type I secretion periplasmic adaptor subunit [Rhizobiales bacterium]|nr:HlyD family type I secretion periplasmic adaptor subunit [Hyphomicrobiales bacterium]
MSDNQTQTKHWSHAVPTGLFAPTLFGIFILLASIVGFGIWATTAPLQGAVVASGRFVATGANKTIQHYEGGIIKQIRVGEGDHVKRGDVLVTLDDTGPKANLRLLTHRDHRLLALKARLVAESKWASEIRFDSSLTLAASRGMNNEVRLILSRQREQFASRRDRIVAETDVLRQEIAIRKETIKGLRAEIGSINTQLDLVNQQLESTAHLYEEKLLTLPKLLELKRARARLNGRSARLNANVTEEEMAVTKIRGQILHLRATAADQAITELRKVEGQLDDVHEQLRKAHDVLDRVNITAPVDGVVVKLMHHTTNGVVKPGGEIMELVPVGDEPIIEARVRPQDIDQIENGQAAQVRLTALNQRLIPTVPGKVVYVSADTVDGRSGGNYVGGYVVRVQLEAEHVAGLSDFRPVPGMPAEAFIKTEQRTFFSYLMRPLVDSMARAFRES